MVNNINDQRPIDRHINKCKEQMHALKIGLDCLGITTVPSNVPVTSFSKSIKDGISLLQLQIKIFFLLNKSDLNHRLWEKPDQELQI